MTRNKISYKVFDENLAVIIIVNTKNKEYQIKVSPHRLETLKGYNWSVSKRSDGGYRVLTNYKKVEGKWVYKDIRRVMCNDNSNIRVRQIHSKSLDFRDENLDIRAIGKSEFMIKDGYAKLFTGMGETMLVDIEDVSLLSNYAWSRNGRYFRGYVQGQKETVSLHRLIMSQYYDIDEYWIDHINHKEYDNRKSNLRVCTPSQNRMNSTINSDNTSEITGVYWAKRERSWKAFIMKDGENLHLGYFKSKSEAIKTRKEAEEKYFGRFSYDNSINK